jgi:hypothetical protein
MVLWPKRKPGFGSTANRPAGPPGILIRALKRLRQLRLSRVKAWEHHVEPDPANWPDDTGGTTVGLQGDPDMRRQSSMIMSQ